jgi:hypothetical protein
MTDEQLAALAEKYRAQFAEQLAGKFEIVKVACVGYGEAGHPFMIGPKHIAHAADHCCGMLGEETMRKIPCCWPNNGTCRFDYDSHKAEYGIYMNLLRDLGNKEAAEALSALKPEMEKDELSGVALPNLNRQYKIAPMDK